MAGSSRKLLVDLRERVRHHVLYSFYFSAVRVKGCFCLLKMNRRSGGSRVEDRGSLFARNIVPLA